jgi:hypothetical protein
MVFSSNMNIIELFKWIEQTKYAYLSNLLNFLEEQMFF